MSDTITYKLTHVQQSSAKDCWAAALAMLLGRSVGPGTASVGPGGGLLPTGANLRAFAASHNLKILPPARTWTPEGLAQILAAGPILIMGNYSGTEQYIVKRGDNLSTLTSRFGYKDHRAFIRDFSKHNPSVRDPNLIIAGRAYTVPRKWSHAAVIAGIRNRTDILLHDPAAPAARWVSYLQMMSLFPEAAPVIMQQNSPF